MLATLHPTRDPARPATQPRLALHQRSSLPLALWLSPSALGIDRGCRAARSAQSFAHDNLFHSMLGMMDVSSTLYDTDLDLLARCRAIPPQLSRKGAAHVHHDNS